MSVQSFCEQRVISCIGFGDRAVADLLPALFERYPDEEIYVYSLSAKKYNLNGRLIKSLNVDSFFINFDPNNSNVIVVSISNSALTDFCSRLRKLNLTKASIYIDTPITGEEHLNDINASSILVLEDFPPSPIGIFLEHLHENGVNLFVFYKSFYRYHGYSLIRLLAAKNADSTIKKIIYNSFFQLYKISSAYILVIGRRDYRKAKIFGLSGTHIFNDSKLLLDVRDNTVDVLFDNLKLESYRNIGLANRTFPALQDVEFCKKLGLQRIFVIRNSESDNDCRLTYAEQAAVDYINTI